MCRCCWLIQSIFRHYFNYFSLFLNYSYDYLNLTCAQNVGSRRVQAVDVAQNQDSTLALGCIYELLVLTCSFKPTEKMAEDDGDENDDDNDNYMEEKESSPAGRNNSQLVTSTGPRSNSMDFILLNLNNSIRASAMEIAQVFLRKIWCLLFIELGARRSEKYICDFKITFTYFPNIFKNCWRIFI